MTEHGARPEIDEGLLDAFGRAWCHGEPRATTGPVVFLVHASSYDGSVAVDDAARLGAPVAPTGWYDVDTLRDLPEADRGPSFQAYVASLADTLGEGAVLPVRWDHLFALERLGMMRGTHARARLALLRRRRPVAEAATALLDEAWDEWRAMEDSERHDRLRALLYGTSRAFADARAYADGLGMRQGSVLFEIRRRNLEDYAKRLANAIGLEPTGTLEDGRFEEGDDVEKTENEVVRALVGHAQALADGTGDGA